MGQHTYSIPTVGCSCNSGCEYSPSPSSGSVTISTGPGSQSLIFAKQYYLTMTEVNTGNGICGSLSPFSEWVQASQQVTIQATWSTGCSWQNWSGSGTGSYSGQGTITSSGGISHSTHTITVGGPITETGTFHCNSVCGLVKGFSIRQVPVSMHFELGDGSRSGGLVAGAASAPVLSSKDVCSFCLSDASQIASHGLAPSPLMVRSNSRGA